MLELKFAIYYRAASLPSQASYAALAEESEAFFKHSPHTNSKSPRVTSNLEKSDGLVHCSMKNAAVLCENPEEEEEEEEDDDDDDFGRLVTFWFSTFAILFSATGCVVRHENTRR